MARRLAWDGDWFYSELGESSEKSPRAGYEDVFALEFVVELAEEVYGVREKAPAYPG